MLKVLALLLVVLRHVDRMRDVLAKALLCVGLGSLQAVDSRASVYLSLKCLNVRTPDVLFWQHECCEQATLIILV
jgi:hypothetical protein